MREVVDQLHAFAKSKGVSISAVDCDGSQFVAGDGPQLRRLLLNLLDNAIKYTPSGGCGAAEPVVEFVGSVQPA